MKAPPLWLAWFQVGAFASMLEIVVLDALAAPDWLWLNSPVFLLSLAGLVWCWGYVGWRVVRHFTGNGPDEVDA